MANLDLRPVESCQGRPEAHGEDAMDLAIQTSASNVRRNPSPSRLTGRDVSVEDFQSWTRVAACLRRRQPEYPSSPRCRTPCRGAASSS